MKFGERSSQTIKCCTTHRYQVVKVRIGAQGTLRHEFLATCWTFFVATAERCDDAVAAEPVQTLLGRHRLLEHIEADRTPESRAVVKLEFIFIVDAGCIDFSIKIPQNATHISSL